MLKEWELAVDRLALEPTYIVPVLVGEYTETAEYGKIYQKFGAFAGLPGKPWPDKYSTTCRTRTIKQTMEKLFSVQGIHCDPGIQAKAPLL